MYYALIFTKSECLATVTVLCYFHIHVHVHVGPYTDGGMADVGEVKEGMSCVGS